MNERAMKAAFVARLARDVYALTEEAHLSDAMKALNRNYEGAFQFSQQELLKGKTGGPGLIKCKTAFGFVLLGKGPLDGHAFILFRGTQYLADHLTNLNFTLSRSAFGQPVHDGFKLAFKSMEPQLQAFIRSTQGKTIHCIGHSLGGALATICAEWLAASHGLKPYLYTFGSPC